MRRTGWDMDDRGCVHGYQSWVDDNGEGGLVLWPDGAVTCSVHLVVVFHVYDFAEALVEADRWLLVQWFTAWARRGSPHEVDPLLAAHEQLVRVAWATGVPLDTSGWLVPS